MADIRSIVILTGAGISAESGLATFRAAAGLWEGHRVEDVATPEAFVRDPALVHGFYDARRAKLAAVRPNAAHEALARLDAQWPGELLLVTQNVDDLHERAGAKRLIHMHGELTKGWCVACGQRFAWVGSMSPSHVHHQGSPSTSSGKSEGNVCPVCRVAGQVRPDIVWFGEMPYAMELIEDALRGCDLFVSIGTSGAVYPAAGFVQTARYCGARTLEINLEPSLGSYLFDESRSGKAGQEVPKWVDEVLLSSPERGGGTFIEE
ncbi:MAG: NAD-dependent deacylase [Sphingomicrobium sp.]